MRESGGRCELRGGGADIRGRMKDGLLFLGCSLV